MHVRKERHVLRHVADVTLVRRQVDPLVRRKKHPPVDGDGAPARPPQSGDRVEDRGLAGARRAEERRRARVEPGLRREQKRALRDLDVEIDHPALLSTRRFDVQSAANAIATETTSRVSASESCPVSA